MNKWGIKSFILLLVIFLQSGCMTMNTTMEIKDDKSMTITIEELIDSSKVNKNIPYFSLDLIKEYESFGFLNKEYKYDDLLGHKLTRTYDNIDSVSTEAKLDPIEATENILSKNGNIFNIKKGLFYNTYKASFNYKQYIEDIKRITEANNEDLSKLNLNFTLKLPNKAISNNATSTSGKTYNWKLLNLEDDTIDFEFRIYNKLNIAAFVVLILLLIGYFL